MFLFTNAPTSSAPAKDASPKDAPASEAMRIASANTGVSFDYLMKTAKRESNLDSSAKAKTSSATGLYQFLDQTWLSTLKSEGAKFGLSAEASQIVQGKNGYLSVPDSDARVKILGLRNDPVVSSKLAAAFTLQNQAQLSSNLGRVPSEGELYIAHFMGAGGAGELIRLASHSPDTSAAASFPAAAGSNKSLFYEKSGEAKTVAQVYSDLVTKHDPNVDIANTVREIDDLPHSQNSMYRAKRDTKPLLGLFQGNETGPVAMPIQNAWSAMGRNAFGSGGQKLADLGQISFSRNSFFPSADENITSNTVSNTVSNTWAKTFINVPLPPEKPINLVQKSQRLPLNLLSFINQR